MKKTIYLSLLLFTLSCSSSKVVNLSVSNPTNRVRTNEMVEVAWDKIDKKLKTKGNHASYIVLDNKKQEVPYQLIKNGSCNIVSIIFPTTLDASEQKNYRIKKGNPKQFEPMVYGRLVPERKDDFTWENNRVAFRVYGPALEATGEISNGMDYWAKKTDKLIIDKWYKDDLEGKASYHEDHGEGLDFYKVGRTLGLGMTAPTDEGKLSLGKNFINAEILDMGPLRISFKLSYKPYKNGDNEVNEKRIITLDAYSHLNKVTNIFNTDGDAINVATGIVTQQGQAEMVFGDKTGIIAYRVPADVKNGTIYTGVINPKGFSKISSEQGHYLGKNNIISGSEYTYYVGAGWSKAGFSNFDAWVDFLKTEKFKIDNPLIVQIK